MARTDNLTNFLTDVADSIRAKTGKTDEIKASSFDTEIASIETGGGTGGDLREYFDEQLPNGSSTGAGLARIIKKIPSHVTFNSTIADYLFYYCMELESVPAFNMSKVTSMNNCFDQCSKLTTIPDLDTGKVTSMKYTFRGCSLLKSLPISNTSNVTDMNSFCNNCKALVTIPDLDTSKVTDMNSAFSGCTALTTIPLLDLSSCSKIISMAFNLTSLTTLGGFKDLGKSYLTTQNANNSNYRLDLSYSNNLTHDSLMNVINNLYDIASLGCKTQSLKLGATNLNKLSDSEKLIAQNKGWTLS